MIKVDNRKNKYIDAISDILLIYWSYLIAFYIRFYVMSGKLNAGQVSALGKQKLLTFAFAIIVVAIYYGFGRYRNYSNYPIIAKELVQVVSINFAMILLYTSFLYIFPMPDFSRLCIGFFYLISTLLVSAKRVIILLSIRSARKRGVNMKRVIVVGGGEQGIKYIEQTEKYKERGSQVEGYIANDPVIENAIFLGNIDSVYDILNEKSPDEVIIALGEQERDRISEIILACERTGTRASIIPYYNAFLPNHPQIEVFGESKLINIRSIPLDNLFSAVYKRMFDILFSAIILILISPVLLVTAILIKLTDPGPVFFCQERVGKDKKNFKMYKFRSMRTDVDHSGWSTNTDSRRTPIGNFIRKFSIDELPQFWNVFIGDMSVVGPRPEIPNFVRQFSKDIPRYLVRQQVRPGITGWAQINGYRGDTSIKKRIEYDIWYIENWTWLLDLKIIARTIFGGFINSEKTSKGKR